MSELALGVVVFTFIAVPASLLLLALADVIRLEGEGTRRRWIRNCLWALAVPASIPFGIAAWGWAGAAHLEPLCQAYALPEFRSDRPVAATSLIIVPDRGSADVLPPAWAQAVVDRLRLPSGPLDVVIFEKPTADRSSLMAPTPGRSLRLEVRRIVHHENLWFRGEMDRFRLVDAVDGITFGLADELWIDAGRARYHCGILSGATPMRRADYPAGDGLARFVRRVLSGS